VKLGALRELAQSAPKLQGDQLQLWLQEKLRSMGMDPGAIYQELEMTSRFVDTHRDTSYSNAHMQLHSHTFYEMLFCCNSCGAEYMVGSERYRLQKGDIIMVSPGISHRPLLPENMSEAYSRYVLWLSPEFMELFGSLFPNPQPESKQHFSMLRTGGTPWEEIGEMFRAGVQEAEEQRSGWEAAVIGNTIQLLTQIMRAYGNQATRQMQAEKPELLDRITAYVEANYAAAINIKELSRQFFVSSSTVSHLFKQKLGVSLYRYVTQRRLIAAKILIEEGLLLESVAAQTGFLDYSSFYRAFRQEFGISPRQYRCLQEGTAGLAENNRHKDSQYSEKNSR